MFLDDSFESIRKQNSISSNDISTVTYSSISTESTDVQQNQIQTDFDEDSSERHKWTKHQQKKIVDDILGLTGDLPMCCKEGCVRKFTVREIQQFRYLYCRENNERKRILINIAKTARTDREENKFILGTESVCVQCFSYCTGISYHSIYNCNYQKYKYGKYSRSDDDMDVDMDLIREKKYTIISMYFINLRNWNDTFPDSGHTVLPHTSKYDVFINYLNYLKTNDISHYKCSYSYFITVWKEKFVHIKLRRTSGFTHCEFCEQKKEILATTMNSTLRDKTKKELHLHREFIRNERNVYYVKRARARLDPKSAVSIIIDGSDMANYGLPHFATKSKDTVVGYKMLMKMVGVIVHGIGCFLYVIHKNWAADPNLTIEILHRLLSTIEIQSRTLYIQVTFIVNKTDG